MDAMEGSSTSRDRVIAVLERRKPDRLPFVDRLELWFHSRTRTGTMPEAFRGLSLIEVHRAVGIGQQLFLAPYALKLRGVELVYAYEGEPFHRELDPELEFFPALGAPPLVARDKPGTTSMTFITPLGEVRLAWQVGPENFAMGIEPYVAEHLIKDEADYRTVEHMLERAEFIPRYEQIASEEARLGGDGFVIPQVHRIPFQQILLEYLGEVNLFYTLYDNPALFRRLMDLLDEQLVDILQRLARSPLWYIELGDNLHSLMTNPRLFQEHCLPYYQRYSELLHGEGKLLGSHTDGELKPLLGMLADSGLDVCESFSPKPLTECEFEEAWETWRGGGPIIWGGIPSPILEERTPESEFHAYLDRLLTTVGDGLMILGVGDMVLGNNAIERVRAIAERVEAHALA